MRGTRGLTVLAILVVLTAVVAYGVYDWTRPCVGGPLKQLVLTVVNAGSYTVRCAG